MVLRAGLLFHPSSAEATPFPPAALGMNMGLQDSVQTGAIQHTAPVSQLVETKPVLHMGETDVC